MTALTPEARAELRRLLDEGTDGPWRWRNTSEPLLMGDRSLVVMAFARMGMQGAQPLFRDEKNILRDGGKANLNSFPDAALIVALRNNAEALLDAADSRDEWRSAAIGAAFEAVLPGYEPTPADVTTGIAALRQYGTHRAQEAERLKAERDQLRTDNDRLTRAVATLDRTTDELAADVLNLKAVNDRLGRELTARGLGHVAKRGDT